MADVDEIVLVDWDSSPPLLPGGLDDKRLRLVRVEGEPLWVLSRAYNLALSLAKSEWIIRLDCDCRLAQGFLSAHFSQPGNGTGPYTAPPGAFWSGRWQDARDGNEVHLNGALLARRSDLRRVHGYDERIQTYGWDDEDLYARLQQRGLKKFALRDRKSVV